jgi:chromosome segregation ATPase
MWSEEVRARLEALNAGVPPEWLSRNGADIRAALAEIERRGRLATMLAEGKAVAEAKVERLRAGDEIGKKLLSGRDQQIETLRAVAERLRGEVSRLANLNIKLGDDAANAEGRARSLESEVERLRARVKRWEDEEVHKASCCVDNQERAERAEAEVERLREALSDAEGRIDDWVARVGVAEARVRTLEAMLREYRDILGGSDPEREDGECCRCGEPYNVRPGQEYTPECDSCAHVVLGNARAALREEGE